ncbi:DUF2520 domain-containing protein [Cellulophaga sp. BC115SP]|uniref:Rossmann-like and DUF2520 domain-containing protein n=1 Tax=Cellulophaga sp. BC115SP TaxID=2683263 RepID=UPI00141347DD|nr:DUF2520 domain-containing protein [Cellulophaga sp. BC115SP]
MKISFIGAGNVAWHLSQALETANYDIETVYSRNPSNARALTQQLYNAQVHRGLDFLDSNSDIFFLCVSDDAMEEVIRNLSLPSGAILVHTSGSKTLNELQELVDVYLDETIRTGVFYPLQTFTKMFHVNFSEIPICLESSNLDVENLLITLAQSISDVTYAVNSEERKRIHLAAVYACNFTNHLWGIAQDLMKKNDLEFKLLEPLIKETLRKALESEDIFAVQTGPARRNDQKIIQRQIGSLKDHTGYKKIYESITEDIIDKNTI